MGLFDSVYGADPRTQGLLAAGAAMMGGPSRLPVSLGQSIGQGYMAGNQAYQQAMQLEAQRKQQEEQAAYRKAQIDKMKADAARKDQMESAIRGLLGGGPATEAPGSLVAPPVGQSGPDSQTLQKVGTAMLIGGDPRGSGILELGKQRSMAEERAKEMQAMTATGTTKRNPTPEEAAIPVQAGAAERFMGPEAKVIPGLHQRAIALGNWIQRNPSGDPAYAKKELAAMDKMVEDYNAKMTADNSAYQREEENRRAAAERANADLALREQLAADAAARRAEAEAAKKEAVTAKETEKRQEKADGKEAVDTAVATLRKSFQNLNAGGGITSTAEGVGSNLQRRLSQSGVGQAVGGAIGSNNQKERDAIAQTRPLLLAAIMRATGMTAKQMDSNAELKLWLATATDPTLSLQANLEALDRIEKLYGTGSKLAGTDKPASGIPSAADIDAELARRKAARQLKGN